MKYVLVFFGCLGLYTLLTIYDNGLSFKTSYVLISFLYSIFVTLLIMLIFRLNLLTRKLRKYYIFLLSLIELLLIAILAIFVHKLIGYIFTVKSLPFLYTVYVMSAIIFSNKFLYESKEK